MPGPLDPGIYSHLYPLIHQTVHIFLAPDALFHVKHIKNHPVWRDSSLAMKEIGDIPYLLVMAERKGIRENSTEIIIRGYPLYGPKR